MAAMAGMAWRRWESHKDKAIDAIEEHEIKVKHCMSSLNGRQIKNSEFNENFMRSKKTVLNEKSNEWKEWTESSQTHEM